MAKNAENPSYVRDSTSSNLPPADLIDETAFDAVTNFTYQTTFSSSTSG
jgi:hypothetical protein